MIPLAALQRTQGVAEGFYLLISALRLGDKGLYLLTRLGDEAARLVGYFPCVFVSQISSVD